MTKLEYHMLSSQWTRQKRQERMERLIALFCLATFVVWVTTDIIGK